MKSNTIKIFGVASVLLLTFIALFQYIQHVSASITVDQEAASSYYKEYQLLASTTNEAIVATTTTATSSNITAYADSNGRIVNGTADVRGAKKIVLYFSVGGISHANTGTTTFNVQVSPDGVQWLNFNRLTADVATSAIPIWQPSVQIPLSGPTATTTQDYYMDATGGYSLVRCIAVVQGSEESGCAVGVTY